MKKRSQWNVFLSILVLLLLCTTYPMGCGPSGTSNNPTDEEQSSDPDPEQVSSYFPISVWLQQPRFAAQYKAIGINLYIGLWDGPTAAQLEELQDADMPVICDQNDFALQNLDQYDDTIVGWMHGDEPDNAQWNDETSSYDPCIEPAVIVADYNTWKANDPTRPVYLNFGQGVANVDWVGRGSCSGQTDMYPEYIAGADVISFDIYPVTSERANVQGNLWYVAEGVKNLRLWSNDEKPVWCWIETTHINNETVKPTPSQVKSEVWMALIHGATGIGYFCHEWYPDFSETGLLDDAEMAAAVGQINGQITDLAQVLNSGDLDIDLLVETSGDVPVAVMYKSRQHQDYIFAVNMRDQATTATFDISSVSTADQVEVLYENRNIQTASGTFQDAFDGYAVHRYRFQVP